MSVNEVNNKNKFNLKDLIKETALHTIVKPLRTIGKEKGLQQKKGLWINNLSFKDAFKAGQKVNYYYNEAKKVLFIEADKNGKNTISCRKSDPNETPILDIKNQRFTDMYQDVETVEVKLYKNRAIVKVAKVETTKNTRTAKTGLNVMELFSGGGVMSKFFANAGFNIVGGLEIESKYLNMFKKNHPTAKHTILSALERIMPSDYPKNIDILLAGICCTNYTKSNKKLQEAMKRYKNGEATEEDLKEIQKFEESELLTFYVLEAIRAMNPRTVVIEEVEEYAEAPSSHLLRGILKQMGYKITETIGVGTVANRKRWCLVATMTSKVPLENLVPETNKTINDCLETPIHLREWKRAEEFPRLVSAMKSGIGIRGMKPDRTKCNVFTCHNTRGSEPILAHPTEALYSEFTNQEIANIHGLENYELSGKKTIDRQILGQGVCDFFYYVAKRIKEVFMFDQMNLNRVLA